MRRLLDYDAESHKALYWHTDGYDGGTLETVQDVAPFLQRSKELNKRFSSVGEAIRNEEGMGVKVASIPSIVQMKWLEEGINVFNKDHWPAVRKKLNSPDYAYLRTAPGKI